MPPEIEGCRTASGTRYYELGGDTVAERSSTGDVQYLIPDRQGTDTLAVDYQTLAPTRRSYLPFGQERTAPSVWPGGDDGYVGGTPDPATGLENLGARQYDPSSGRFMSPDPVFEANDPTQLGGYDYAGNDPVTGSDPTGTMLYDDVTGLGFGNVHVMHDWYHDQGYTDSHGHATQKYANLVYRQAISYLIGQYELTHPQPKPKAKPKKPWWKKATGIAENAGKFVYHASGAADVVGCVSDPSVGGCIKAGALVAGFLATGGEDELEIAALEAGEDLADKEAGDLAEDAASCLVPHSFTGNTPVLEAGGATVRIAKVRVGDVVMSTDPQTGETSAHVVQRVIRTTTDHDFTALTIAPSKPASAAAAKSAAGAPRKITAAVLTTTWHHPFWNVTTSQWTDASHLTPGTRLREADGTTAVVTAVRNYHTTAVTYDLTVANLHSYYVLAGATPVLVHNCDGSVFYHGTDGASARDIWENGLKASAAASKHMDGVGGFFLATERDDAVYYALRRQPGALIKATISSDAMATLRNAGAELRDIPYGGPGTVSHVGQEFHIPESAFDVYNSLRDSGGIQYGPG
ncbi:RHS repeat-associated core domain-containing protein [Streptomyces sp. NPDC008139]|uniref:RHS repeat-associated core domain-containing protein n=1 Tax=Streptomyces sp. NPDC008139 TaxID=3364814 RepID=UPI0036EE0A37